MKKICVSLILLTFMLSFYSCNNNSAAEQKLRELQTKQFEIENEMKWPILYIDVNAEILSPEKIFNSKWTIRCHIKNKAQYTKYTDVVIRISFFSKNNVFVGSEDVYIDKTITSQPKIFEKKVKLPRDVSTFKCEVIRANAVQ